MIFLFIAGYLVGYFSCIANKNCSPSKIWLDYIAENGLTKKEEIKAEKIKQKGLDKQ